MVKKGYLKSAEGFFVNVSAAHYAVTFIPGSYNMQIGIAFIHMVLALISFMLSVYIHIICHKILSRK